MDGREEAGDDVPLTHITVLVRPLSLPQVVIFYGRELMRLLPLTPPHLPFSFLILQGGPVRHLRGESN